jgi:transitional endoplasmic reticulum ATPase
VGPPDETARREIARIHANHFKVEIGVQSLDALVHATAGCSGDEIKSLFRDSCVAQVSGQMGGHTAEYELGRLVGDLQRRREKRQSSSIADRLTQTATPSRAEDIEEAGLIPIALKRRSQNARRV